MAKPVLYPIFLDLNGARVLIVGGGDVAARKMSGLLSTGANVIVVALSANAEIQSSAHRKKIRLQRRAFQTSDLRGARLVFAATDNLALNRRIAKLCRARGIAVNVAAPPDAGDAVIPGMVRRGPFCIAVSTGGASAALARHWRQHLEKIAGLEWGILSELLETRRARILRQIADDSIRATLLRQLAAPRWAALIKKSGRRHAAAQMDELIARALKASRRQS
jgi:precorrin-2 dehydrogenase / sirohydrochlorin ferrochelatase